MRKLSYLVDEGVLLTKEDEEFESYSSIYDKKYGYYDEGQYYVKREEDAIAAAKAYVENGVDHTYAVVSKTVLPDDFDYYDQCVEDETYLAEDVIYSVAKIDGKIVEGFVDTKADAGADAEE